MMRSGLVATLALLASAAFAAPTPGSQEQPEAPASLWRPAEDHLTFTTANIDVPRAAGVVHFTRSLEFSHPGEGLDSALQYQSADGQVFATLYAYFPGLPQTALAAFTTDWVIHLQSQHVNALGVHRVAAGGRDGVALRADYGNYRNTLASSAAFIKVDRWIVKIRVSGPEARRAEVETTMTALLAGLRFNGPLQPRSAIPFDLVDCQESPAAPAHALPDEQSRVIGDMLVAVFDGGGEETVDRQGHHHDPLPARVGERWCQPVPIRIGDESRRILRTAVHPATGERPFGGRTVLLSPIDDAGEAMEEVEFDPHHFILLYHEIGRTELLGAYDGPLSDAQVADIMSGADRDGGRVRASVEHRTNGGSNTTINVGAPQSPARGH